jgi:hypothetical protein
MNSSCEIRAVSKKRFLELTGKGFSAGDLLLLFSIASCLKMKEREKKKCRKSRTAVFCTAVDHRYFKRRVDPLLDLRRGSAKRGPREVNSHKSPSSFKPQMASSNRIHYISQRHYPIFVRIPTRHFILALPPPWDNNFSSHIIDKRLISS